MLGAKLGDKSAEKLSTQQKKLKLQIKVVTRAAYILNNSNGFIYAAVK
jgi:hypothetical protein